MTFNVNDGAPLALELDMIDEVPAAAPLNGRRRDGALVAAREGVEAGPGATPPAAGHALETGDPVEAARVALAALRVAEVDA